MMQERMRDIKVLLVLDDVNHIDQLVALAGQTNWFKKGSRIIVTTRDQQVLQAHRVNFRDIDLLSDEEAIFLFSRHAFGRAIPSQGFKKLSEKVGHENEREKLIMEKLQAEQSGLEKKRVNKKVMAYFEKAEDEYNDLISKKNIIENGKSKIKLVIEELDDVWIKEEGGNVSGFKRNGAPFVEPSGKRRLYARAY